MMKREATVERFIGALTMALGIGALIPRAGLGLYALLEAQGLRALWSLLLINFGCLMIVIAHLPMARIRIAVHGAAITLWLFITYKFVDAQLWGAALQGSVIISFSIASTARLIAMLREQNGA